ncbi:SRPBCC domain-containing protein [Jiangella aurantiaca]|uniref:SRPBCC domain-containing protein n=1 Tax=Jiangella aurantiaca TaxID=2530373 RepID=A0A4R5A0Q3_9ACTN|nr:SRPBCC domain-containing protein [Jiangella aurantiaca]TDD65348.1 SRPBCC domain-containing protein [Jiangella aurantiaca]
MGHEFRSTHQADLDATPEEIWQAIATGPGIDSWFMGRADVEPGPDGSVRIDFGGYAPAHDVTAWEPGKRLAYSTEPAPDGRFVAYEFLLEGRDRGSTTLRVVASGFLPGDDWADEFEAMSRGHEMFFQTLFEYLTHFAGRTATPVTAFGPPVANWERAWARLHAELGLSAPVAPGDGVRLRLADGSAEDGVVYYVNADTLGIRTNGALIRFLQGFQGPMIAAHHVFADDAHRHTDDAWQAWLTRVLG